MENDKCSNISSPVRIALFGRSSCSYSKKRKCVRFDVVRYRSLETHCKIKEIMSNFNDAFRLYVDFGSISTNQQFYLDYLNRYRLLPLVLSLATKTLRDDQTRDDRLNKIHDFLVKTLDPLERSMLPEKSKLEKCVSSSSHGCAICNLICDRKSRFNHSALFMIFEHVICF